MTPPMPVGRPPGGTLLGASCSPFACLPNHVVGKSVIKRLRQMHPESNIVAVDYDPGASEVNQLNRIKLMISVAKENFRSNREGGFLLESPNDSARGGAGYGAIPLGRGSRPGRGHKALPNRDATPVLRAIMVRRRWGGGAAVVRLVFVDMDDTFVSPDKTISPDNLRVLDRAHRAGAWRSCPARGGAVGACPRARGASLRAPCRLRRRGDRLRSARGPRAARDRHRPGPRPVPL